MSKYNFWEQNQWFVHTRDLLISVSSLNKNEKCFLFYCFCRSEKQTKFRMFRRNCIIHYAGHWKGLKRNLTHPELSCYPEPCSAVVFHLSSSNTLIFWNSLNKQKKACFQKYLCFFFFSACFNFISRLLIQSSRSWRWLICPVNTADIISWVCVAVKGQNVGFGTFLNKDMKR